MRFLDGVGMSESALGNGSPMGGDGRVERSRLYRLGSAVGWIGIALTALAFAVFLFSPWADHEVEVRVASEDVEGIVLRSRSDPDFVYGVLERKGEGWIGEARVQCNMAFLTDLLDAEGRVISRTGPYPIQERSFGWRYTASMTVRQDNSIAYRGADANLCYM